MPKLRFCVLRSSQIRFENQVRESASPGTRTKVCVDTDFHRHENLTLEVNQIRDGQHLKYRGEVLERRFVAERV